MQVDIFRSTKNPSVDFYVPCGTSLDSIAGLAGQTIRSHEPSLMRKAVPADTLGHCKEHVLSQIADQGAAVTKIGVRFEELLSDIPQ